MTGCTVKFNMLLHELPNFTARPGTNEPTTPARSIRRSRNRNGVRLRGDAAR